MCSRLFEHSKTTTMFKAIWFDEPKIIYIRGHKIVLKLGLVINEPIYIEANTVTLMNELKLISGGRHARPES